MSQSQRQHKRKVFIVEDHAVVREGMVRLINDEDDLEVCGQAASVAEAMQPLPEDADIVLIDLSLPDGSGLDVIQALRRSRPEMPALVLSMHDESLHAERALRAGARGYVMKQEAPEQLMQAIRQVLEGQIRLSEAMSSRLLSRLAESNAKLEQSPLDRLTGREYGIYEMIGQGRTPSEIAERLGLSVKTVDAHRENIKRKLGLRTAAELMRHSIQHAQNP